MLVDVHAHLEFPNFEQDLEGVIERAKRAGIVAIINSGTTLERCKKTLELTKKYPIIKASLGIYPTETTKMTGKELEEALEYIKKNKNKMIALGEVGLDFHEEDNTKEKQKENFQKIIELAEKIKLPIIIHSRKAEQEAVEMLEKSNVKNHRS